MIVTASNQESLAAWVAQNSAELAQCWWSDGFILFRGFEVGGAAGFEQIAATVSTRLYKEYGDLPLARDTDGLYNATPYPNNIEIKIHNEASNTRLWPSKQFFHCVRAADEGGAWTLLDGRNMLRALPAEMRERFSRDGLMYRRRFIAGLDVDWREYFRVQDLDQLRAVVSAAGYSFEFDEDDNLTVSCRTPAIMRLPGRDLEIWFNQILLHHPAALPPDIYAALSELYEIHEFPRSVCFGNGEMIPDEWIHRIEAILAELLVTVPNRSGDVLMVNNQLLAHGRAPYTGPRQVLVALGDMMSWDQVTTTTGAMA